MAAVRHKAGGATHSFDQSGVLLSRSDLPAPGRFAAYAFGGLGVLIALSSIGATWYAADQSTLSLIFHKAFWVDTERNAATLANVLLFLLASGLCIIAALETHKAHDRHSGYWIVLTVVTLLLAYDEAASIHELLIGPVNSWLGTGGSVLTFAWVVPGAVFAGLFGAAFSVFLWKLPKSVGMLMIAAGAIYVLGALGAETMGGAIFARERTLDLTSYKVATTIEEALEMTGLILFSTAILRFLQPRTGPHRGP